MKPALCWLRVHAKAVGATLAPIVVLVAAKLGTSLPSGFEVLGAGVIAGIVVAWVPNTDCPKGS